MSEQATASLERQNFQHFLRLARRGRFPACSSGERAAYKIAMAVIDHCPSLDESACEGLCEFLRRVPLAPMQARELIGGK